jgi:hypothetical protein
LEKQQASTLNEATSRQIAKLNTSNLTILLIASKSQAARQKTRSAPTVDMSPVKAEVEAPHLKDGEVVKRLRTAQEPVTLFGEDEKERYKRLISLENVEVGYVTSFYNF